MARRTLKPRRDSTSLLPLDGEADAFARPPSTSVRTLSVDDLASADLSRIRALAERFAEGWSTNPPANGIPVPDGRRAAAADIAETRDATSFETVKRLSSAIQEIIDWIATQICMHRIPGAHVRGRFWPDLEHEAHLAKRSGLTRAEWNRLTRLLSQEASLPIIGRLVPGDSFRDTCWVPDEASLSAWSLRWNWDIVHRAAEARLAG